MIKKIQIPVSVILLLFLYITGCSDKSSNPVPVTKKNVGWVAGGLDKNSRGTVLYTNNSGETWQSRNNSDIFNNTLLNDVCVINEFTAYFVGDGNSIIKTRDAGITWTRTNLPDAFGSRTLSSISFFNENVIWVSGDQGTVYKTLDGGQTWSQEGAGFFPSVLLQGIKVINEKVIYVASSRMDGYAARTTDGGMTWDSISFPPNYSYSWIGIGAIDTNNVYIHGATGHYIFSSDAGHNWTGYTTPQPGDLNCIAMYNNDIFWFACDFDIILTTTDAGSTWTQKTAPGPSNQFLVGAYAINRNEILMVGQSASYRDTGKIIKSTDGGSSWAVKYLSSSNLFKIAFAED